MTIKVTIDKATLDRTTKTLDKLATPKARENLVHRAAVAATNRIGEKASEGASGILAKIAGVARRTISPRSTAASSHQAEPRHTVDFPTPIPIRKLRSTKVDREAGTVEFRSLAGALQKFNARPVGGEFELAARNPLPKRLLGGIVFSADPRKTPELEQHVDSLAPGFEAAFESELESLLAAVNRRG